MQIIPLGRRRKSDFGIMPEEDVPVTNETFAAP
jgi:hypothetical protein